MKIVFIFLVVFNLGYGVSDEVNKKVYEIIPMVRLEKSNRNYHKDGTIYFKSGISEEILHHELVHVLDQNMKWVSCTEEFSNGIMEDVIYEEDIIDSYYKYYGDVNREDNILVQDLIDALSITKISVYYNRDIKYYKEDTSRLNKEIFANLGAIYLLRREKDIKFVEDNFPRIVREFKKIFKEEWWEVIRRDVIIKS